MLRSALCDYSDAYVVIKGTITVSANTGDNNIKDEKTGHQHLKVMHDLFPVCQK